MGRGWCGEAAPIEPGIGTSICDPEQPRDERRVAESETRGPERREGRFRVRRAVCHRMVVRGSADRLGGEAGGEQTAGASVHSKRTTKKSLPGSPQFRAPNTMG